MPERNLELQEQCERDHGSLGKTLLPFFVKFIFVLKKCLAAQQQSSLVLCPGIEPVEAWSLIHWTSREVPLVSSLKCMTVEDKNYSIV